jgi:predicted phosphodiesterase
MYSTSLKKHSMELANSLIKLANEDNVNTTLICGNHDPTISETEYVWLCNKTVFVFHGHAPFIGVTPWSWRGKYITRCRRKYIRENGDGFKEQFDSMRMCTIKASSADYTLNKPSLIRLLLIAIPLAFKVLWGWWEFPKLTNLWIERYASSAKIIVAGHTHHAGIWKKGNRIIINTGCFGAHGFPSNPRAVVIEQNTVTVHKLKKHNGNYSLGRVCGSWEAL